ncbi:asparaginase [Symbiobacterium terraclitae]|uniref:asparaginase n=1 Tax=Symbiobacterium terraclitae TaxID=557451 RepID=UPI0035B54120
MAPVVVEWTRGPLVESQARGDAAVVDATGRILFKVGDGLKVTYWRSAAKPVQALPVIASGAVDRFGLAPEHVAVMAASHNAEPVHVETVLEALKRAGLSPDLLQCGAHPPMDREAAAALQAADQEPGRVHSNCSGKHTGMLVLAKHLGLPLEDYLEPQSAVQQLILQCVARVAAIPAHSIAIGVDGCGVPVFGMPLRHMALAYARLADPDHLDAEDREAGLRMRAAMWAHPYLVAGRGRICTDLMSLPGRRFLGKSGAEGVYSVGLPPETVALSPVLRAAGAVGGVGITVKAEDGRADVSQLMAVAILDQLGLLTAEDRAALARYGPGPITNYAGRVVGERRAAFALTPAEVTV